MWDAQTGLELLTFKAAGLARSMAFSPDGHRLVSAAGRTVTIWDATPLPEKPDRTTGRGEPMRNAGGGSGPGSPPPLCSRTMSQPGDGPWFVPARSYVFFRTPSNHTLSGRRPRVAFIVAPPCRADRSCRHAGLGAVGGGDGDRAPIDRRPPLRVWERRIAGHARGAPPRIESSKDSDILIGGAPFLADRAPMNRWAGLSPRIPRG